VDDHFLLQQALQRAELADQDDQLSKSWMSTISTPQRRLPFSCTACGKCCRTKGSVYLSPTEIQATANFMNMTQRTFIETYASHIILPHKITTSTKESSLPSLPAQPRLSLSLDDTTAPSYNCWMVLKNHPDHEACIFLDHATNACTIYQVRPSQCSTYPFWPAILQSQATWNDEVRRPSSSSLTTSTTTTSSEGNNYNMNHTSQHETNSELVKLRSDVTTDRQRAPSLDVIPEWTPELGGCEGMKWISTSENRGDNNNNSEQQEVPEEEEHDGVTLDEAYRLLTIYIREERDMPRTIPIPIDKVRFD
jgi:Fe-S-cluster containining protein